MPDPSFGTGGVVNLLPGNGAGGVFHEVRQVAAGPDGSTFVHYRELPKPQSYECEAPHFLVHYRAGGAIDTGFGISGQAQLSSPIGCGYPTLAVDRQGRPLVTWTSQGPSPSSTSTLAVNRLLPDGTPDPTFGAGGTSLIQIPCPPGTGADAEADGSGRVILRLGCRDEPRGEGEFHLYLARLDVNGALDASFGGSGFVPLPAEPAWWGPSVSAIEPDGSILIAQTTEPPVGSPTMTRLLRVGPGGAIATAYTARVERSLRQVASLGFFQAPEEATAIVLRPKGGIALAGRSARGGWVVALRHDGSLDPDFSHDGYRRFLLQIRLAAGDHGRLLLFGWQASVPITLYALGPDGNRVRPPIGGERGQRLGPVSGGALAEIVSTWRGLPLLYLNNLTTSCTQLEACTEPAELVRLHEVPPLRGRTTAR